ncbi:sulfatase family protein [Pedobacter sp. MW01-1-1]|uniref:sulfatase family protein n=1 Tax=Pedobacter sp. MW01-1-1 TaxID=3383027 RepID=UPI003FEDD317
MKTKRANTIHTVLAIIVFALSSGFKSEPIKNTKSIQSPNIIIILCDDMGYGDIARFGATQLSTPNLDKLASDGMTFTDFYAAEAICTASRASLLTGCYSNRISLYEAMMPNIKKGLNPAEKTIAEILKEQNYATAIVGKWHLGNEKEFLPLQHGFDEYFGLPYSNDMWPVDFSGKPITDTNNWRISFPPLPLIEGNQTRRIINTLDDQAELTTLYTEKALNFIERNKKKPFFLYFAHSMPHVPLAVSSKFKGKSKAGLYGDVIMEIDWSVGEIMNSLKKNKLDQNTLVIFTSDNGPWLVFGNHAGSTGGLREGKGTSWDGGQKVPCIMRWPKVIPAGTTCNKMASTLDLLPTIAHITRGKLSNNIIDGVNIFPLLQAQKEAEPRTEFYYYYGKNNLEGVRKGQWKLVLPHTGRTYEGFTPGKDGFPGSTDEQHATQLALYNLRSDPGERYDQKDNYPEIVADLQKLANKARADLGDNLTNTKGKNVRDCGHIHEQ